MIDKIKELIEHEGWNHYGWARLERPLTMNYYKTWIQNGMQGEMTYLERHIDLKENPQNILSTAKTAFVFAKNYLDIPEADKFPFKNLNIALYAQGKDYHIWFQNELDQLCLKLKSLFPNDDFIAFTDSKPVLERDLAYRAGLGWVGKNTCLINEKKGSLFLIGEIYSSIEIQAKLQTAPDRCGNCRRCIDACPTGALVEEKILDARKCISYWTIESKSFPNEELFKNFQSWYFGCDICQTVCPWNQKNFGDAIEPKIESKTDRQQTIKEIDQILKAKDDELKLWFKNTPLERTKPWGHKRNALIVAYNLNMTELIPTIECLKRDHKLNKLAETVLRKLQTRP